MNLEIGDIVVVKSRTFIGRTIRWITKSWASHVAVYVGSGFVFEARPGGAKSVLLTNYSGDKWEYRIYRPQVDIITKARFIHHLILKKGRGYDYGQIISILVDRLFNIKMKAQNRRLAICSEIIYEAAKEAKMPLPVITQAYITPGDFENWSILERIS